MAAGHEDGRGVAARDVRAHAHAHALGVGLVEGERVPARREREDGVAQGAARDAGALAREGVELAVLEVDAVRHDALVRQQAVRLEDLRAPLSGVERVDELDLVRRLTGMTLDPDVVGFPRDVPQTREELGRARRDEPRDHARLHEPR